MYVAQYIDNRSLAGYMQVAPHQLRYHIISSQEIPFQNDPKGIALIRSNLPIPGFVLHGHHHNEYPY